MAKPQKFSAEKSNFQDRYEVPRNLMVISRLSNKIFELRTFFLSFGLSIALSAFAVEKQILIETSEDIYPAPIAAMIANGRGVKFQDKFDAPGGLKGYVLSAANGERRIYYVTPDNQHVILGLLFDEKLNNLTADHQRTYMNVLEFLGSSRVDPTTLNGSAYDMALRNPYSFVEGRGVDLFVVFDSQCDACARFYNASRLYLDRIKIHWIPGALGGERATKWMAVFLEASNKSAVLAAMFSEQEPPPIVFPTALKEAQENAREIVKSSGSNVLPVSLFMDLSNEVQILSGPLTKKKLEEIAKRSGSSQTK